MPVLTVVNQKGGVGKTTTALTIAAGLAIANYDVLLIDGDSQGNISDSLGLEKGNDLSKLLFPTQRESLRNISVSTGVTGLDVIRSDKHTSLLKLQMGRVNFREFLLDDSLKSCDYDFVLIDCAPSLDIILTNALIAADYIFIPTKPSQLSLKGVKDSIDSLRELNLRLERKTELLGLLPTFVDRTTTESATQLEHLVASFGGLVFPPIPVDTKCREATRLRMTLWDACPTTRAVVGVDVQGRRAGGYQQVVERIIREIG